ncbi:uncharacterized protein LOC119979813 [Tripterygium wilfordii]|uniref:uncharacterized protein LOC119979813 n=1 Tax=Tripterygium wilfordii TaxID=458696 RepID=UPI0018F85752|nr:uncharacterized protein LOC119979813 [Tripterygium wilfordii]
MEGEDPLVWIHRAEQYFLFYVTPNHHKVVVASFNLEGEVFQWFRWMNSLQTTPRWEDFTIALCKEFGPSEFEDSAESLLKLKQIGSLATYVSEYRRLANRTPGVSPGVLKSYFLGGLKPELRYDVKLLKPETIHDAIAIAVQLYAKLRHFRTNASESSSGTRIANPEEGAKHGWTPRELTSSIIWGGAAKIFGGVMVEFIMLTLRTYNGVTSLFVLHLGGSDVVLGVQWLST